jgi:hypothetical protein
MFDLLGRLATQGHWAFWNAYLCPDLEADTKLQWIGKGQLYISSIKALIINNPALFLPVKDDHAIDIFIAVFLLALDEKNHGEIKNWLAEITKRASFAYAVHGRYPCIFRSYNDLLSHPKSGDDEYRKNVTNGSILYPIIALWSALLDDEETYKEIASFKQEYLQHCNFQLWYPDEDSEMHFYTNDEIHGAVLSNVCVDRSKEDLLAQVFDECEKSPHFKEMSAFKLNWWPLIIVACRHYRLPLPLHLLQGLRREKMHADV